MKRILVLPGGGAKGYLQLNVLAHLEKRLNKKIADHYDLIVGTSVGGITGAVLASGRLYASEFFQDFGPICKKTFSKNYFLRPPLVRPIYSRNHITDYSNSLFGDSLMNSLKTKLILTSVSELDERTHFFKSWESKDGREPIKDVVLRTFAAPYFFGHVVDDENRDVWMDGATGINNDATDFAYTEAWRQGWTQFEITVIGTGNSQVKTNKFEDCKNSSQISQILKFISPLEGGLARTQFSEQQVTRYRQLVNNNFKYNYVNVELPESLDKMDYVEDLSKYDVYADKMKKIIDNLSLDLA